MDKTVKIIVLEHQNLISEIDEVQTVEIGDPNCKLTKPFVIKSDGTLEQFLIGITRDTEIMMGSCLLYTSDAADE